LETKGETNMIRNVSSYPEILRSWEDILVAQAADSSEIADLQPLFDIVKANFERASELVAIQNNALAERQLAAKELQGLLGVGARAATVLRNALKVRFGPRSDKLLKFGIQPEAKRRPRTARPKPEPVEPARPAGSSTEPTVPSSPTPSEPTE
jgi:hypothetical protein